MSDPNQSDKPAVARSAPRHCSPVEIRHGRQVHDFRGAGNITAGKRKAARREDGINSMANAFDNLKENAKGEAQPPATKL